MNNRNPANVTDVSIYFKYKSSVLENATGVGGNRVLKNTKVVVPLKYLSNFFRSLEMSLINCNSATLANGNDAPSRHNHRN